MGIKKEVLKHRKTQILNILRHLRSTLINRKDTWFVLFNQNEVKLKQIFAIFSAHRS